MRINVDDQALRDPRICKRLPRITGLGPFDAFGRLVYVWGIATDRRTAELAALDVDDAADHDGFAAAMVRADLADDLGDNRVRVRGITDRIGYLNRRDEIAVAGGKARAASAPRAAGGRFGATDQRQAGDGQRAAGERPACDVQPPADLDLDLPPDPDPDPDHDQDRGEARTPAPRSTPPASLLAGDRDPDPGAAPLLPGISPKPPAERKAPRKAKRAPEGRDQVIAAWRAIYEREAGQPPTIDGAAVKAVDALLASHSAAEIIRRMGRLWGGCLDKFDLPATLLQFASARIFDRLARREEDRPPPARRHIPTYGSPPPPPTPPIPFPLDPAAVADAETEIAQSVWPDHPCDHALTREVAAQFFDANGREPTDAERRVANAIGYRLREELIARRAEERAAEAAKRAAEKAEAAAREAEHPDVLKLVDAERKAHGATPIKRGPAKEPTGAAAARAIAQRLEAEERRQHARRATAGSEVADLLNDIPDTEFFS